MSDIDPTSYQTLPTNDDETGWGDNMLTALWTKGTALVPGVGALRGLVTAVQRFFVDPTDFGNPLAEIKFQEKYTVDATGVPIVNEATERYKSLKSTDSTVNITDDGNSIDLKILIGQKKLYNPTGTTIPSGTVLHLASAGTFEGETYPVFEYAKADKFENCQGSLVFASGDVAPNSIGNFEYEAPKITADTSGVAIGAQLWLSPTVAGGFTDIPVDCPDLSISIGGAYDSDVDGEIWAKITSTVEDATNCAFDGIINETFNFTTSSDGVTVTGLLENVDPTRNLTLRILPPYTFDTTTSPATITLTPGTDSAPITNYVFIPATTKLLTTSTSGWPAGTYCQVAQLEVGDPITVQSDGGCVRNQNINNHLKTEGNNGHIVHMNDWMRERYASHRSGTEGSLTGTPTNGYIQVTGGVVRQVHNQIFPSISMPIENIRIVNDFTTAYRITDNLNTITAFSTGVSWSGWSNITIWGVANKTGEPSFIFCNLPRSGYNSELRAFEDRDNHTDYSIPDEFEGVGFLIARFTVNLTGGTVAYNPSAGYMDLRKTIPNNIAGGGGGGSVETIVPANTFIVDKLATYGYSSIQTALTAAGAAASVNNYQTVLVYAGTYIENLVFPEYINLIGVDPAKCILSGNIDIDHQGITQNVEIKGFTINYTTTTDNSQALRVTSDGDVTITDTNWGINYSGDIGVTGLKIEGNSTLKGRDNQILMTKTGTNNGGKNIVGINAPVLTSLTDITIKNGFAVTHITGDIADNLYGVILGGQSPSHISNYLFQVQATNASYTGTMRALQYTSNTTVKTGGDMTVRIDDFGNGTFYAVDVPATSGSFITNNIVGYYNGTGSAYAANVNIGATLQTGALNLDGITALSTGSGTINAYGLINGVFESTVDFDMGENNINNAADINASMANIKGSDFTLAVLHRAIGAATAASILFKDDVGEIGNFYFHGGNNNSFIVNCLNAARTVATIRMTVDGYTGDTTITGDYYANNTELVLTENIVADLDMQGFKLLDVDSIAADSLTISISQVATGVSNNTFFRDSGRSDKLSYKGVAGVITEIEA
jgi:hypothetical protein